MLIVLETLFLFVFLQVLFFLMDPNYDTPEPYEDRPLGYEPDDTL